MEFRDLKTQYQKQDGKLEPKVIIAVDLFGLPANYPEIRKIADQYDLKILEDAVQGFGGMIGNQRAGSFGDAATTSFFPAKPLGCYGDGGAIFTDDKALAERINSYKIHGKGTFKYDNVRIGMNSRLDTIQAVILQVKLKAFIDYELDAVNQVARWYTEALKDTAIKTPQIPEGYLSSWAQYAILLPEGTDRDQLQEALKAQGIPTMVYYSKLMHKQTAFRDVPFVDGSCEVTEKICCRVIELPSNPYLSKEKVKSITKNIIRDIV